VALYKLFLSKLLISHPINVRARVKRGLNGEKKLMLDHLHHLYHLHSLPLFRLHHLRQSCSSCVSQADLEALSLVDPVQRTEALFSGGRCKWAKLKPQEPIHPLRTLTGPQGERFAAI
jgi:hypothetical protein